MCGRVIRDRLYGHLPLSWSFPFSAPGASHSEVAIILQCRVRVSVAVRKGLHCGQEIRQVVLFAAVRFQASLTFLISEPNRFVFPAQNSAGTPLVENVALGRIDCLSHNVLPIICRSIDRLCYSSFRVLIAPLAKTVSRQII